MKGEKEEDSRSALNENKEEELSEALRKSLDSIPLESDKKFENSPLIETYKYYIHKWEFGAGVFWSGLSTFIASLAIVTGILILLATQTSKIVDPFLLVLEFIISIVLAIIGVLWILMLNHDNFWQNMNRKAAKYLQDKDDFPLKCLFDEKLIEKPRVAKIRVIHTVNFLLILDTLIFVGFAVFFASKVFLDSQIELASMLLGSFLGVIITISGVFIYKYIIKK